MTAELAPLGPDDPDLLKLSPDRFEDLVFLLAHAENSGVVPIRAKDHGLDARLPSGQGRMTTRGWQAKRFTNDIKWDKCVESVRRAMAFWRPQRITFCFPRDLSGKEQDEFRKRLVEAFPQLILDYWTGTELKRRMRADEEGRRATRFLFGDPSADIEALRRATAVGGELNSSEQALARLSVVNEFIQRDPHFRYGIEIREPGAPPGTPARGTLLSVELARDESSRIRLHASERYPGAAEAHGPAGALVFDDSEAGRTAREELDRIAKEGGSTTLDSGIGIRMDRVPEGVAEFFSSEVRRGRIQITALPARDPAPRVVPLLLVAGEAQVVVDFMACPPPDGWKRAERGECGGLAITFAWRHPPTDSGSGEPKIDWRHTVGIGSTIEQLLALELLLAGLDGAPIEFRLPDDQPLLTMTASPLPTDDIEELRGRRDLLALLAEIEAWTGTQLHPPASWEQEDAEALDAAIPWIRNPFREDLTDIRLELIYNPEGLPDDLDGVHQFAVVQQMSIELFGEELWLGKRMLHIPAGQIVEVNEADRKAVVMPIEGGTASIRLFPPGESAPVGPADS